LLISDSEKEYFGSGLSIIADTKCYFCKGDQPSVYLTIHGETHHYSDKALELISSTNGYILDFGSGVKKHDQLISNVVLMDAILYPYVDIVNSGNLLPFKSGVFDAVISQAVFEHLPDPKLSAMEIYRVLKPGGVVLIETAFMQPFHGDPNHYFNMTKSGLREVMKGFDIIELGIRPYQKPSYSLSMQFEAIMPFLRNDVWRSKILELLELLHVDGHTLDSALGEVGSEVLAAGVYVLAKKPIDLEQNLN
jgi:SAM-dependent methyltransferase